MGVKIDGMVEVEAMIFRIDTTLRRRAIAKIVANATELQQLAIKMAPVDHGGLEGAIKVRVIGGGRSSDSGRFDVEVYIDGDMDCKDPKRPNTKVGDYDYEVHELVRPQGFKELGDRSKEKQANNGGVIVGGGFMTRAAEELDEKFTMSLGEILDELF